MPRPIKSPYGDDAYGRGESSATQHYTKAPHSTRAPDRRALVDYHVRLSRFLKLVALTAGLSGLLPAAAPPPVYVLKAARMFDGKSNALVTPGLVVVAEGKIFGVGQGASVPPGAVTIDLGDATLLPGFIDAHTHLSMDYKADWQAGRT